MNFASKFYGSRIKGLDLDFKTAPEIVYNQSWGVALYEQFASTYRTDSFNRFVYLSFFSGIIVCAGIFFGWF